MVRHTLKILQQMLLNFEGVPDHFGTLYIKGLRSQSCNYETFNNNNRQKCES